MRPVEVQKHRVSVSPLRLYISCTVYLCHLGYSLITYSSVCGYSTIVSV